MLVMTRYVSDNQNAPRSVIRYVVPPSKSPTVIEVSVLRAQGNAVRVGSEAPRNVQILRLDAKARIRHDAKKEGNAA